MASPPTPLLLLLLLLLPSLSLSLFSPTDNLLLDCGSGSSSPTTLPDRRSFLPDSKPSPSARLLPSSSPKLSLSNPNPNPNPNPLYRTARIFTQPSAYEFRLRSNGPHLLRLHFYPFSTPNHNISAAKFHVTAANFVLLFDFAFAFEVVDATPPSPQLKEYFVPSDSGKLTLSFVPVDSSSFAFVNAIEVVSVPDDLVADEARLVDLYKVESFSGVSKNVLQTIYRINVGGSKITSYNDSLWRNWVPDSQYLVSSSPSKIVHFSGRVAYRKYGASREVAPDFVYNSGRISNENMTWAFPADPGYNYLIRMHFCDIASLALNELYFNVYINGYSAYSNFDISDATGQLLASPYYIDFVTYVYESELLRIGIGPSKFSTPLKVGGLLNGLEIMKINNTVGSLDGETSIVFVVENTTVGTLGPFFRTLLCGFAFVSFSVVLFMLVLRWRAEMGDLLAWARLPVDVSDCELVKETPLVSNKLVYF